MSNGELPTNEQIDPQQTINDQVYREGLVAAGFFWKRRMFIAKAIFAVGGVAGAFVMNQSAHHADQVSDDRIAEEVSNEMPALSSETTLQAEEFAIYKQLREDGKDKVKHPLSYDENKTSAIDSLNGLYTTDEAGAAKAVLALTGSIDQATVDKWSDSYNHYHDWLEKRETLTHSLDEEKPNQALRFKLAYLLLGLSLVNPLLAFSKFELGDERSGSGSFNPRRQRYVGDGLMEARRLGSVAEDIAPDVGMPLPDKQEIISYLRKARMMPPIGTKIVTTQDGKFLNHPFLAQYTADTIVRNTRRFESDRDPVAVHQLTVQGRLPDRFKYAGMILLMNSPIENDWDKPFYNAPWGSAGPMIHDGGNTYERTNKHWKKVHGRTDFLQRIVLHFDEERDDESLREIAVLANQTESMRILTEARFYQRAALALHCTERTAPKHIPQSVREQLANLWEDFERSAKKLLSATGAASIIDSTWFLDEARPVAGWRSKRYEADYGPIKEALQTFESSKKDHPEVREIATRAMIDFTDKVDNVLDASLAI